MILEFLKIKEDVNPEDLKKFGFKAETKYKKVIGYQNPYINFYTEDQKHCEARELNLHTGGSINDGQMMANIYDLIKADLVEKCSKKI